MIEITLDDGTTIIVFVLISLSFVRAHLLVLIFIWSLKKRT